MPQSTVRIPVQRTANTVVDAAESAVVAAGESASFLSNLVSRARNMLQLVRGQYPKTSIFVVSLVLYYVYRKLTKRRKNVVGDVVLITGAGSGLGRNLARRFAALSAKVVCWDINTEALESVGKEISGNAGMVWTYNVDVTNHEAVYAAAARVQEEVGQVDILINNAGVVSGNWITDLQERKVLTTFAVNTISHFWTVKAFLPYMIRRNRGHVVTVASAAGTGGVPRMTDYCASKFAAVGFDESLRVELGRRGHSGVKTTCICPYYINTGMFDGVKTRFSFLLPILSEDYAAKRILQAILFDEQYVVMPRILYLVPILRGLLPVSLFDTLSKFLGITASMDEFKGRTSPDEGKASGDSGFVNVSTHE